MKFSVYWCRLLVPMVLAVIGVPQVSSGIDCDTLPTRIPVTFDSIGSFQYSGGNDCWGWRSGDGTDYAIFGAATGVAFVNTTTMQEDDFVPLPNCGWRDMKTYQNYCFAVSECGPGLVVIDMSYLPDSVHWVTTFVNGQTRSHNMSIDVATGFAYLVKQAGNGFRVIDINNPTAPVEYPQVSTVELHDIYARNDTVWAACGNTHTFSIWDMSNKNAASGLVTVFVPGTGYVHNIWPTIDGNYLVTTEETPSRTVKIWDAHDLGGIFLVTEFLAPSGLAHNAHVDGNYLYLSHYQSGVYIFDLTYPDCPVQVAFYDTWPFGESSGFSGCWGVFPHTESGKVYSSNIDGKMMVFQTNIQAVNFSGTPQLGAAPLSVDFTDLSKGQILERKWQFGDGDTSVSANPSHVYDGGLYTVQLQITTTIGDGISVKPNFVTALAESVSVADTSLMPDTQGYWDIDMANNVPIKEITIPVSLSNVPSYATLDSISRVGTRTEYFEFQQTIFNNIFFGELVVRLKANNSGGAEPLPPGSGPVVRAYYTLKPGAVPGETITLSTANTIGGHALKATTLTTVFNPEPGIGYLTVLDPPCQCLCHGDPASCEGIITTFDVVAVIDVAFRDGAALQSENCPVTDTDVSCDGITDVFDVISVVDVAFRGVDPDVAYCDPCAP